MGKIKQTHRSSVVTKDRDRVLSSGERSKNSRQSPSAAIYTWMPTLHPPRIVGGESGSTECFCSGTLERLAQTAIWP